MVVADPSALDLRSSANELKLVNLLIHFFDVLSLEGLRTDDEGIEDDTD